ncbi:MAG: Glu-tRNA(Gln) amidotransferase subunit GatD [Candidatus Methanomethylicia archaeon]|nr:Glu-tRNA(Gln) amidotransferase subunit GatD [Candidatus Methanomethylicia archaeon]
MSGKGSQPSSYPQRQQAASGYKGKALDVITASGVQVGDALIAKNEKLSVSGILMPRSELDDDRHIVIKLKDGYNLGISVESLTLQRLQPEEPRRTAPAVEAKSKPGLPKVAIISTGGTIASRVDYKTGAVSPALTAGDLYQSVPELGEIAEIRTEILYSLLSENISPENWKSMAQSVYRQIKEGADGVVITHGTDTMGFTAAALSFALQDLPVPVILVGSQRSSDRPSSDAYLNLKGAVLAASRAPFAEVGVLMHKGISDNGLVIHRGTRVRKMHTSRRDAFKSVNSPPLAYMNDGQIEALQPFRARSGGKLPALKADFDPDVVLIKSFPGIPPDMFDPLIHRGFHGIVLEGTGLGHVPEKIFHQIRRAIQAGITVVMASQCIYGRVNMNVYSTGRELLSMGVIPAGDMLPETALVKLMWVLGQTTDKLRIRELFSSEIAGELSQRSAYTEGRE